MFKSMINIKNAINIIEVFLVLVTFIISLMILIVKFSFLIISRLIIRKLLLTVNNNPNNNLNHDKLILHREVGSKISNKFVIIYIFFYPHFFMIYKVKGV